MVRLRRLLWEDNLVSAWVWQGCHTLLHLCKSVLSVEATSLPEGSVHSVGSVGIQSPTDFTDLHRWLGCVCSSTEFTEFTEVLGCCWLRGYGRMPYPPNLCASVRICGRLFSARNFCAFRGFCGNIVSHGLHRFAQMAWLRLFSHGIHRSFGVLLAAWVRQDAIPS